MYGKEMKAGPPPLRKEVTAPLFSSVCNFAEEMTSGKHFGEQDMPEYVVKAITALGDQKGKKKNHEEEGAHEGQY